MSIFDSLWVEKYRPSNLQEMVLDDKTRISFEEYKSTQMIPNLLFIGNAGIGKTSLAKVIAKDVIKDSQYLYINASDENGIDTIRVAVTNFAKTRSLTGALKIVILDEVDGLTMDAQRALRNTMEEYSSNTRFINCQLQTPSNSTLTITLSIIRFNSTNQELCVKSGAYSQTRKYRSS